MAYSESLAQRIREIIGGMRNIVEKRMFGGVGFLMSGHMTVGVWKTSLIVRLDPADYHAALQQPDVVEFNITGRPMKGWIMVEPDGLATDEHLAQWVEQAIEFVRGLPEKE
jgi:TfoX/Sxy family transcriptional regulator of competence genes